MVCGGGYCAHYADATVRQEVGDGVVHYRQAMQLNAAFRVKTLLLLELCVCVCTFPDQGVSLCKYF